MSKVQIVETPSQQIAKKATETAEVIDARGRIIQLRKPGVLMQYRLVEMMGESAKNETYMGMVLPILFVCGIDEDSVPQPSSKREVEALIQRLDEDGIGAVIEGIQKHFGGTPSPEADKAALKK